MTGKTTPLYVVCSPCRCVGTTLVSRLLTEFYVVDDRPVAAFDLADEGPQLADYLPEFATIADIGDIRGQMALFDRLIAEKDTPRVIDVSHRAFEDVPEGLSLGGMMYEQFRKPIREQSIRLEHHSLPSDGESVYAVWQRVTAGKKR
jgi:hypothetical protein